MSEASANSSRRIQLDYLTRVEGEGALSIQIADQQISQLQLKIFEPPRFFEGLLQGRDYSEAPDVTSRICGICPFAYQMSSIQALETALDVDVGPDLSALRRLLYCGEWIASHTLHIYMLHGPDYLGYANVVEMAKAHPQTVTKGLALKKAGNDIMALIGGREIHPINARVGGFYRLPSKAELDGLAVTLKEAEQYARDTLEWTAGLPIPEFQQDYLFVALRQEQGYPMDHGRVVSSHGLDIPVSSYEQYFEEQQVPYSHALQAVLQPGAHCYQVGPLARYALNFDRLPAEVQRAAEQAGLSEVCNNPFASIQVRAVEVLYAVIEAQRLINVYRAPAQAWLPVTAKAANGYGATEAPRGILYHRYQLDQQGLIQAANIIPPTSQNQQVMERDIRHLLAPVLDQSDEVLGQLAERSVRNYDPCISCATHFLKLDVTRE